MPIVNNSEAIPLFDIYFPLFLFSCSFIRLLSQLVPAGRGEMTLGFENFFLVFDVKNCFKPSQNT